MVGSRRAQAPTPHVRRLPSVHTYKQVPLRSIALHHTRMDEDGQCLAGDLRSLSNFAPKDWHEATNVCAAEGKVLCGVDKPCSRSGCMYDLHYQWTGEECQAGDAGLPAAC